jgi:hypothetical protein
VSGIFIVCDDFAPDSLGDAPQVCIACLNHVDDHHSPFAYGWSDGFEGLVTGITYDNDPESPRSVAYDRGRTQGEIDRERVQEGLR